MTDISEEFAAESRLLRNVGNYLLFYTASHSRSLESLSYFRFVNFRITLDLCDLARTCGQRIINISYIRVANK